MFGSVTRKKVWRPAGAQHQRGFLFVASLRLHVRNQFACDKRNGDETWSPE